jgi:hypothetical protein
MAQRLWSEGSARGRLTSMEADLSVPARPAASLDGLGLRVLAWGVLSFIGFIAVFVAVGSSLSPFERAFGISHAVMLGLWALAWVPVTGLLTIVAARMTLGGRPEVPMLAWLVLLLGALVSSAHVWVLADWAVARYGYSDPDYIGPTFILFGVVAGAAVAGFGIQIAPRWAVWLPSAALVGGIALAISIISSNFPGLADGLARDSGPLAAVTGVAAAYIGAVGILSLVRLRRV